MNEKTQPVPNSPARPTQTGDLDDLIFRGEGWLTSDR